jgi:UDP-N-acetylglucosamine 2-epimerase
VRTLSIIGARPQFIKIAPVCRAIERFNGRGGVQIEDVIVHTGQHYDEVMSAVFFGELKIPRPAVNLGIGSGGHGEQTGRMLIGVESVMKDSDPDVVIVYGDTNSTLAGVLAAAKLNVPVAHVEAGLRSFNRRMPEEINRVVADHVSDILYAPTDTAMANLRNEGRGSRSVLSGDVMYDAVQFNKGLLEASPTLRSLGLEREDYVLVTIHRAENTSVEVLSGLLGVMEEVASLNLPVIFPMHPRTKNILAQKLPDWRPSARLHVTEPVGYLENLFLIERARVILTDSGGMQKEAFFVGTPCITLRGETEWLETVESGGNIIAGTERANILAALDKTAAFGQRGRSELAAAAARRFGGGKASDVIVEHLASFCGERARHVQRSE